MFVCGGNYFEGLPVYTVQHRNDKLNTCDKYRKKNEKNE